VQICIQRQSEGERFWWAWNVTGGHLGEALAVLERIKAQTCLLQNAGPVGNQFKPAWWNDWEPATEEQDKICIGYVAATGQIDVSVKGLTPMQLLEGLIDAQYTMAEQWFRRVPAQDGLEERDSPAMVGRSPS
jgi:hypothetical protein